MEREKSAVQVRLLKRIQSIFPYEANRTNTFLKVVTDLTLWVLYKALYGAGKVHRKVLVSMIFPHVAKSMNTILKVFFDLTSSLSFCGSCIRPFMYRSKSAVRARLLKIDQNEFNRFFFVGKIGRTPF